MSMYKKASALVCMVLLGVTLVFAGGSQQGGAQSGSDVVTLKVLNYLDASQANSDRDINEIWGEFAKRYPNIKIEREDLFNEPFHQKTSAYIASGQLPDVLYMWPSGRSSELHAKKLVKDLTPFLKADNLLDKYIPAAVAPQFGGFLGELPSGVTFTHVLYVNTKLLKDNGLAMPKTYEELKAMVPVLKAKGLDTVLIAAQDDWVMQSCLFSMIVGRIAGDEFIDNVLAGKAKFTDKPFVDALALVQDMFKSGVISQKALQTPYGEVPALFAAGKAPFLIDGDWRSGAFQTDVSTGVALIPVKDQPNIAMTVFPALPGEKNKNTSSSVVGAGFGMSASIPAGSAKEKAAWELIKFLQSEYVQKIRLETGASFPSLKGVTVPNLEPISQTRAKFYENYKGTYVLDGVLDAKVYAPINIGLQEIGLGTATPAQVAEKTQKAFEAWKAGK
ncbi:ABC transporter substrate-binding protein [Gracilinema caldarium]|uniref:Extracellular solute-binding protein family 1 n=1 Tax=Gracilinema caldarium (strain ATCC 51460 / DSM 7334 / H1) TaxID=744872 RepID=F8EY72_GRAC1|nr:extracellular solute-binding protein [Gracilinema caldarium]AEJ18231.1 extracellular solute-binding protein family 1 [Gracilinema caldarium DSM 7334]